MMDSNCGFNYEEQVLKTINNPRFSPEKKEIILKHLLVTKESLSNIKKHYSHVPCKFYKQGNCQAGTSCPFSHSIDNHQAFRRPCKYYKLGICKFGEECVNSHDENEILSLENYSNSSAISYLEMNATDKIHDS
ncbi:hypothetical protein KAFR_0A01140 [Kazachstania africana CBS 2517]|uniref:C3H1-type domain-containing protein n=1 Tax=Kazachstania africana (strain ATCC 22294 / BCRC 22015 / CBS 2517 / CECT 1963 / NBRC 1671 / NRRL Y-8276) TaxID=1071382 RepID=H2AMF3_KAZAF|nr:hypothetical protein KAFR_0A01140 [Kazachstania africana CBS 2517]CCF55553.1 hypothetical protein KAFR_0A01140 [Kazachstania africana CBS 2517]